MIDKQVTRLQSVIEGEILNFIQTHHLKKGDRLPSQEELAEELHVSRATLREALARLVNQGIVRQAHGIGTFVDVDPLIVQSSAEINLSITEMIQSQGMQPGTCEVQVSHCPLPNLPYFNGDKRESSYLCIRRVRTANGTPFAYSVAFLSLKIPNVEAEQSAYNGSLYVFLKDQCGQIISGSDSAIEAQVASEEVARKLSLGKNTPVLVLYQLHHNQHGETIVYSIDYFVHNLLLKVKRRGPGFLEHSTL